MELQFNLTCLESTQSEPITDKFPEVPDESPGSSSSSDEESEPDRMSLSRTTTPYRGGDGNKKVLPPVGIGNTTTPHQGEDGNKKVLQPVASGAASSSSSQKSDGNPYNYCNIVAVLQIFCLYFEDRNSAFNKWIDKLGLKDFTNLRTMSMRWNRASKDLVIRMFCRNKSQASADIDYYGNPFKRLLEFAKKDQLLQYQQSFPELDEHFKVVISHFEINQMICKILKKEKCSLEDAVNKVFTGHPPKVNGEPRPYLPTKTSPFFPFHLYGFIERSSQLPSTLKPEGLLEGSTLTYELAGVIFHRSDKPDGVNDHYVVRGYDPVQQKWRYNTETDGDWEEDHGDPKSDEQYEYMLSTVMYIIKDPPGSDPSSVDISENPRFSQPVDETPGNMLPSTH